MSVHLNHGRVTAAHCRRAGEASPESPARLPPAMAVGEAAALRPERHLLTTLSEASVEREHLARRNATRRGCVVTSGGAVVIVVA